MVIELAILRINSQIVLSLIADNISAVFAMGARTGVERRVSPVDIFPVLVAEFDCNLSQQNQCQNNRRAGHEPESGLIVKSGAVFLGEEVAGLQVGGGEQPEFQGLEMVEGFVLARLLVFHQKIVETRIGQRFPVVARRPGLDKICEQLDEIAGSGVEGGGVVGVDFIEKCLLGFGRQTRRFHECRNHVGRVEIYHRTSNQVSKFQWLQSNPDCGTTRHFPNSFEDCLGKSLKSR